VQPTRFDLANAVGLSTTPTGAFYDVIVVGSGRLVSAPRCTPPPRV